MYAVVGVYSPEYIYTELDIKNARNYMSTIRSAGWSIADVVQVVELSKNCMTYYPTDEQWSVIFQCSVAEVEAARQQVKPTLLECFTPLEQSLWAMGCDIDISFLAWVDIVKNYVVEAETFELQAVDVGAPTI